MNKENPLNVPLASHFNCSLGLFLNSVEEKDYMSHVPYVNTVGCLMYVKVCTRPNISLAVGVVSKYMENIGKEHWNVVKWVFRYLRGTSDYCITFNNNNDYVCDFIDLDFIGDLDKRRYTLGYVLTLVGGAISGFQIFRK